MTAETAGRLLVWLNERRPEMVELLQRLVRAESPSVEPRSQQGPFRILAAELERIDYLVRPVREGTAGDHLYARPRRRWRGEPRQLLIGHMDTVWPLGTLTEMPVRLESGLLYGPGTADMKGGLVEIVFALRALHELGLAPAATPVVLVNTDEEIGSVDSSAIHPPARPRRRARVRARVRRGPGRPAEDRAQGHRPLHAHDPRTAGARGRRLRARGQRDPRALPSGAAAVRAERPRPRHHGERGHDRRRTASQRRRARRRCDRRRACPHGGGRTRGRACPAGAAPDARGRHTRGRGRLPAPADGAAAAQPRAAREGNPARRRTRR